RQNILPPADFETSVRRRARRQNEQKQAEESRRRVLLEDSYHEYCRDRVQAHFDGLDENTRRDILSEKLRSVRRHWGHLPAATIEELAKRQVETDLRGKLDLPTLEEFAARSPQKSLFD
ncbi:MAG TPA: hypothetical protein VGF59_12165, partial [Bryobacteraceae bacterium]